LRKLLKSIIVVRSFVFLISNFQFPPYACAAAREELGTQPASILAVAEEATRFGMTPGAGRVKVDATKRNGPVSTPFFTLEGKGNKEHGKEKIERSRFNMALAKNDLAIVEYPVVTAEAEQIIKE
jgi:hypothetical protein